MTELQNVHENAEQRDVVKAGSERAFGIVFACVFATIGSFPLFSGDQLRLWAVGVSAVFLTSAFALPTVLRPLNMLWFRFGMLLHKIINPLVMGLLFFLTVTPIAFIMRLMGKDPLNRRFEPTVSSYWIKRDAGAPHPETMRRQF